jgi:hypothetical protein
MKKTATTIAIVALGAMLAAASATESMARGGGGHGGGSHGAGASHDGGGSNGAGSHEGRSGEHGRQAPGMDDGAPSSMDSGSQSYLFGSPLFR